MKFSLATVAALWAATTTTVVQAASYQSGPHSGAVYAAAMMMDEASGDLYYTGISYASGGADASSSSTVAHCFIAQGDAPFPTFVTDTFTTGSSDACRAMTSLQTTSTATTDDGSSLPLLLVGTADPDDFFDYSGHSGAPQVGFGVTLDQTQAVIAGTPLFSNARVPYPQAVVPDASGMSIVYVASMVSRSDTTTTATTSNDKKYPNWTHLFQHGTQFYLSVQALKYHPGGSTTNSNATPTFQGILESAPTSSTTTNAKPSFESLWTQDFAMDQPTASDTVYVGGMIHKVGVGLIVAGSTSAKGPAYGAASGDDEDGFVAILNPADGTLFHGQSVQPSQRFGTAQYDVVTSICDDPNDPNSFYIVGATQGDMNGQLDEDVVEIAPNSLQAWIRKIQVSSLQAEWTVQLGAYHIENPTSAASAAAMGCIVDPNSNRVYVAGQVLDGAGMIHGNDVHVSQGGQDIWMAALDGTTGQRLWLQQVGSPGDESLARNGPLVLTNNNPMIFGDTTGALYRSRTTAAEADLFTMTFDATTGAFDATVSGSLPDQTQVVVATSGGGGGSITEDFDEEDDDEEVFGNVDVDTLSELPVVSSTMQLHQSGPNAGAMYASSIVYDEGTDQAMITGISYTTATGRQTAEPGCLVAKVAISSMETKDYNILGTDDVLEACRGIAMSNTADGLESATLVVVGNSEPGGLYASNDALQTGFGLRLSGSDLSVQTGASLFSEQIPYPQAIVMDGTDVYVASMTSNDVQQNANDPSRGGSDFPNWTYLNKYGHDFTMTVEKLSLPNFDSVWSQSYPVEPESDGTVYSVHVGGLVLKPNVGLVVVGSTRAKGAAYGPASGADVDGFITVLDPSSGNLVSGSRNNIRIGSAQDDVISEICNVPGDADSVIVVGATKGDVNGIRDSAAQALIDQDSLQWFAKRIRLSSLQEEWTIQGGAVAGGTGSGPTSAYAVGCHVKGNTVFVGGTVENGARMLDGRTPASSMGGNDVWVASLALDSGNSNWVRQFGSVGDDQLARNGGITTDKFGDVLVFGDTTGALYRERPVGTNADIFLAVLSASSGEFGAKGASTGPAVTVSNFVPTAAPVAPPTMKETVNIDNEAIPDDIVAIQLGPDVGPSYAGGMDYDSDSNSIYLTGATFGKFSFDKAKDHNSAQESQCFFARVDLPELEVVQRDTYSATNNMDACTAVAANSFNRQRNAIILGTTEPGGLMTELAQYDDEKQYGFALDMSLQHKFELLGGAVLGDGDIEVVYPVAVVADEESFWTVSMISRDESINPDYRKVHNKKHPNYTGGGVVKYGSSYHLNIESYKYARAGDGDAFSQGATQNFALEWTKSFDLAAEKKRDDPGIMLGGMITVGNQLIVVGTAFNDGILNGMVAKFDRSSGELDSSGGKSVEYYGVNEDTDTWATNACADPADPGYFYVVGATQKSHKDKEHKNKVYPWAAKINARTLETEWSQQFHIKSEDHKRKEAAAFYGCDVVSGGENLLYLAGTIEDGAVLRLARGSGRAPAVNAGGDDIIVVQVDTDNGKHNWMKQIGSKGNDRVARNGAVKVDANGNAIVYGDTDGWFFRDRSDDEHKRHTDIFLVMFDKHHGIHQSPLTGGTTVSNDSDDKDGPSEFFNSFTEKQKSAGKIVGFVFLGLVLLALLFCVYRRYCRGGRLSRRKNKSQMPASIYDASAADDDDDVLGTASLTSSNTGGGGGGFGLFRQKKQSPDMDALTMSNLNYRDDPEQADGGAGGMGSFHKTFSDLPENGKRII